MSLIGRFAVRYRYLIVIFWVLATIVSARIFPSLSSVTNSDNSSFLPSNAPTLHASNLAGAFQSSTPSTATLVSMRSDGALTAADQQAIVAIETAIKGVPHVTGVRDQGVSGDNQANRALIAIDITTTDSHAHQVVTDIRDAIKGQAAPAGLTNDLTGSLATVVDNQDASKQAQRLTQLFSYLIILVLLIFVFRSVLAPLITFAPAVLVLRLADPIIAEASKAGLQISSVTQILLTVLILGAGTDYGLFLTLRVEEELRNGRTATEAVVAAVTHVGESIAFSAGTVIVALVSLVLATFGIYHDLGPGLAIGVALMLLAGLTLLPALLSIFGQATFWPLKLTPGSANPGAWGSVATQIVRRPGLTLGIGLVFFGALALGVFHYTPSGFAGAASGPTGSESALGTTAISTHFPATAARPTAIVLQFSTSVWSHLDSVEMAQQQLQASPLFKSVNGLLRAGNTTVTAQQLGSIYALLGPPSALAPVPSATLPAPLTPAIYRLYRAQGQYVSTDGRTVEFYTALTAGAGDSTAALQAVPSVRALVGQVAQAVGASDNGVLGTAAVQYDVSHASDADLAHILPIVLVLIALLLALVMRSAIAPLYLVASVALSYAASLGLAVIIFMGFGHAAGLNFLLPFLMFVFLMALGEDYNILIMSRIREEAHHAPLPTAIPRALGFTGTTVTSAGLILAATFGVAALTGTSDQIRQLGTGIALGILMDTFLVRTLLVPSIVTLLGRWNWWPSRLAQDAPTTPVLATANEE